MEMGDKKYEGVELANPPLSEQEVREGSDADMISLPHLHEPAILHAVSERYFRGEIYTWTGPVLIAVNPFQRLPLYTRVSVVCVYVVVVLTVLCALIVLRLPALFCLCRRWLVGMISL